MLRCVELLRPSRAVPRGWRPRSRAAVAAGNLAAAAVLLSTPSFAADDADVRATLVWDVGPHRSECMTEQRLRHDVEANLGRAVFDDSGTAKLVARVTIRKTEQPRGWLATIRAEDRRGRLWGVRELRSEAASCHSLDEKLVVVTALMVDPTLMAPPAEEEAWPEQVQAPTTAPSAPENVVGVDTSPRPPRRPRPPRPWELEVDVGAASALGMLPKTAWGTSLGLELRFPWFGALRASASVFGGQTVPMQPAGQTRFRSAAVGASLCPVASQRGIARASLCAGLDVLGTWAESWEIADPQTRRRVTPRSALSFRAAGVVEGRWLLGGGADLAVPWHRDTFIYQNSESTRQILFRPAPFAIQVVFGAGVVLR